MKLFIILFLSISSLFAETNFSDPLFRPPQWTNSTRPTCITIPVNNGCFGYNTSINQFEGWNGTAWAPVGSGIPTWIASNPIPYKVGDYVLNDDDLYIAITAHSSGSNFYSDFSLGVWKVVSPPSLSSSNLSGGVLTKHVTDKKAVNVTAGAGVVIDSFTKYPLRTSKRAFWSNTTLSLPSYGIGIDSKFYIYVDTFNVFHVVSSLPSISLLQDQVVLGQGVTDSAGEIIYVTSRYWNTSNTDAYLASLMLDIGLISKGFAYSGNTNLTIKREAGRLFAIGSDPTDKRDPNAVDCAQSNPMAIVLAQSDIVNGVVTSNISPSLYQPNGAGSLIAVPANKWTIQRFYQSAVCSTMIQFGQILYDTQADAILNYATDNFVKNPIFSDDSFLHNGYIIVKSGATNLSDILQAKVITCGQWGCGSSGNSSAGLPGDVVGPATSTDNAIAIYDGTTGKKIKQSSGTPFSISRGSIKNNVSVIGENYNLPDFGCYSHSNFEGSASSFGFCQSDIGDTVMNAAPNKQLGFGVGGHSVIIVDKDNIGVGTSSPDNSSIIDVVSTNRGFLPPRMNTTQRDAISLASAISEVTEFRVLIDPPHGKGFQISNAPNSSICYFYTVDGATFTSPGGCLVYSIIPILSTDTNNDIATKSCAVITVTPDFSCVVAANIFTVTRVAGGYVTDALNLGSRLVINVTTQGRDITAVAEGLTIYNTTEKRPEYYNGSDWVSSGGSNPPGTIIDFAGLNCPSNFLNANGAEYAEVGVYDKLFAAIGTTWNTFNGQAAPATGNFRVPNLSNLYTRASGTSAVGTFLGFLTARPTLAFTADSQGNHAHTMNFNSGNNNVAHTHSLTGVNTGSGGDHHHVEGRAEDTGATMRYGDTNTGVNTTYRASGTSAPSTWGHNTSSGGAHTHTINASVGNNSANHLHNINGSTASTGAHTHTITGGGDAETRPNSAVVLKCIAF